MTDGRFSDQLPNWINLKAEANIYKLLDDSWKKEKKKKAVLHVQINYSSQVTSKSLCSLHSV